MEGVREKGVCFAASGVKKRWHKTSKTNKDGAERGKK